MPRLRHVAGLPQRPAGYGTAVRGPGQCFERSLGARARAAAWRVKPDSESRTGRAARATMLVPRGPTAAPQRVTRKTDNGLAVTVGGELSIKCEKCQAAAQQLSDCPPASPRPPQRMKVLSCGQAAAALAGSCGPARARRAPASRLAGPGGPARARSGWPPAGLARARAVTLASLTWAAGLARMGRGRPGN